jgi:Tfp pilus assembly PilM family ATPase
VHQLADAVRNSLNFYRMQDSAANVEKAVLTGPAVDVPGFAEALSKSLRMPVEKRVVAGSSEQASQLAVAAGLAVDAV